MSEFAGSLRERIAIEQLAPVRTASGLQQEQWQPVARCLAAIVAETSGRGGGGDGAVFGAAFPGDDQGAGRCRGRAAGDLARATDAGEAAD